MDIQSYRRTSDVIKGRFNDVSSVPGIAWGRMVQPPFRVEREDTESQLLRRILAISEEQIYIAYAGIMPYEILEMENEHSHFNVDNGRSVHKLPHDSTPVSFSFDGDSGRLKITGNSFGILDVIIRDKNNAKKFAEIIVDPQVRDEDDNPITNIDIIVGTVATLTYYAGLDVNDVLWNNPSSSDIEFFPKGITQGRGALVRVKGLQVSGPHTVNVTGQQGTSSSVNITVIPEP